jgi:hypothetical protein
MAIEVGCFVVSQQRKAQFYRNFRATSRAAPSVRGGVLSACVHQLKEMRYAGEFGSAGSTL